MNDLGPIFRTLMRNRLGALLIALQIALTLAIVTNAGFIIQQRAAVLELLVHFLESAKGGDNRVQIAAFLGQFVEAFKVGRDVGLGVALAAFAFADGVAEEVLNLGVEAAELVFGVRAMLTER